MRAIRRFLFFWYDFFFGDDWIQAAGVVVAVSATVLVANESTPGGSYRSLRQDYSSSPCYGRPPRPSNGSEARRQRSMGWTLSRTRGGRVGRITGDRGACEKSKSAERSPSCGAFSRTSGRGSGRPSVFGSRRWPPRKSSSMNFSVGVEAERLVVDVALLGVRADHQPRHPQAVAVRVDRRRHDVVVEAAPVVPGEEDRGRAPSRAPA